MLCVHRFGVSGWVGNEVTLDDMADSPRMANSVSADSADSDCLPQCPRCASIAIRRRKGTTIITSRRRGKIRGPGRIVIIIVKEVGCPKLVQALITNTHSISEEHSSRCGKQLARQTSKLRTSTWEQNSRFVTSRQVNQLRRNTVLCGCIWGGITLGRIVLFEPRRIYVCRAMNIEDQIFVVLGRVTSKPLGDTRPTFPQVFWSRIVDRQNHP